MLAKAKMDLMARKKKAAAKKNPVAQAMVAMRNRKLTPEQRKEIASAAAKARWGAKREKSEK